MGGEVDYRGVVFIDLFNGLFVYHNERVGARGGGGHQNYGGKCTTKISLTSY